MKLTQPTHALISDLVHSLEQLKKCLNTASKEDDQEILEIALNEYAKSVQSGLTNLQVLFPVSTKFPAD